MDWNTETVNITYASNGGYAGHLTASLYSLLNDDRDILRMDIYILSVGVSEAYLERLADVTGAFRCGLRVAELENLREWFDYEMDTREFDISAMGHLFAPEVLSDCARKALHLDRDTIVDGSTRPLCETELGSHLVGTVVKPTVYREMRDFISMERDEPHYNSRVLLMDLEAWRDQGMLGQLLKFYRSREGSLFVCDQDTIDGALKDETMPPPIRYNYFTNYRYSGYKTLASTCGAYRSVREDEYRQAGEAPVIIYYLGDERSWMAGSHDHFRRLHEYYLDKTPRKGAPKQEGKGLYMQMWWALNHMSLICPALRLWISRRLGMRLADSHRRQKTFGSGKWHG